MAWPPRGLNMVRVKLKARLRREKEGERKAAGPFKTIKTNEDPTNTCPQFSFCLLNLVHHEYAKSSNEEAM